METVHCMRQWTSGRTWLSTSSFKQEQTHVSRMPEVGWGFQILRLLIGCLHGICDWSSPDYNNYYGPSLSSGFTAMDIACARKNPTILRLLEQRCPFKGWLYIKTSTFAGLSREWKRRWCVICHRFPYPRGPSTQRLIHVVLLAYKDTSAVIPVCRVWLDGASAVPMQSSSTQNRPEGVGPTQAALKLHPKHELPAGAYTTGYPGHGLTMYLRPDFGGQPSLDAFQAFITLVNNRGMLPGGPSATAGWRPQGAGGAYTPAGPLSDEELARRLQAEEDSAFAAHLASHPELVPPGGANPASGPAPPASSPASFAGAYPAIDFGQRHDEGRASSYPGTPIQGSAGSSAGRPRPPPPAGPLAQSALVSSGSGGGGGTASTTPEATTSATPPPAAPLLINVENSPPRPQTQVRPGEWWAAFPPVEPVLPSSNPSATQSSPSTAPPPASTAAVGSPIASSASTIPVSATVPSGTTSEAVNSGAVDDDEGICVICLEEPATAGFLHGDSYVGVVVLGV